MWNTRRRFPPDYLLFRVSASIRIGTQYFGTWNFAECNMKRLERLHSLQGGDPPPPHTHTHRSLYPLPRACKAPKKLNGRDPDGCDGSRWLTLWFLYHALMPKWTKLHFNREEERRCTPRVALTLLFHHRLGFFFGKQSLLCYFTWNRLDFGLHGGALCSPRVQRLCVCIYQ